MKVVTSTTVRLGAGKDRKEYAPGEHDLPEAAAKDLIALGAAVPAAKAKADADAKAEASKGQPKVETQGSGPKVEAK